MKTKLDNIENISNISNISSIDFNKLIDNNNNMVTLIFDCVKTHDWKKLKKIIGGISSDFDLNIKDNTNTYLLEYAIIFNQLDLINLLLSKNIRIDIVDDYSRSVLYNVIKFSYTDILVVLLEKDKTSIGKSILEIKDTDGNIPLFYAIKFFNTKCIEIILSYTSNFYIKNFEGDNGLHIAIKSQNLELFKLLSKYFDDLKSRNNQGESYLHLIIKYKCYNMLEIVVGKYSEIPEFSQVLNFVEHKYNFSILHYIAIELDLCSLNILAKHKVLDLLDGNIQDNSGNIPYHYFINNIVDLGKITLEITNNISSINEHFKHINFNINLYNIDGNTPAHLFFSNIDFFYENKFNFLITWIGENSNMNIQNFQGESVLFIVVKTNFWKQIKNILENKKLDIFIIASDSETIFDYIEKSDYNEFIDMVVSSYLNLLVNKKTSGGWIDYWDNRCKKIVKFEELNETEIDLFKSLSLEKNNEVTHGENNICYHIIRDKLNKSVLAFIESKNIFQLTSFPVTNKFSKLISMYPSVVISTFSGSTIDVMVGLIYLETKFSKSKPNYLVTSLELLKNKSNIIECKTSKTNLLESNVEKKISVDRICEISDFEILWINKNIFFPSYKSESIESILKSICSSKSNFEGTKWFCVPLGIEMGRYSHANYIIIDIELRQVERFEPHGAFPPIGLNYEPVILDGILSQFFTNLGLGFKYYKPSDYLPKIGFQVKEINELKSDYIGDPNGFCALWCVWWADIRFSNPDISRNKLVKMLTRELINGKYSYKKLIRDYSWYITEPRDKLLIKANTNINEWINDTLTDNNIMILDNVILSEINQI